MEYIRSVKSNIKGGVDIELGPRTVLVGPNGSGKSSVVQAIQLAADGAVRDGEGRDRIKEYGALARFFPSGAKVLFSTLALSNDTQRHWEIKKSGTTWKAGRPEMDFEVFFPFEEVKSILAKGDKEIRAWLSDQILGKIDLGSGTVPNIGIRRKSRRHASPISSARRGVSWTSTSCRRPRRRRRPASVGRPQRRSRP